MWIALAFVVGFCAGYAFLIVDSLGLWPWTEGEEFPPDRDWSARDCW